MSTSIACSLLLSFHQEAVEEASMTQVDHSTFTPQQLSVEKLIKEQNFTWKVRHHAAVLKAEVSLLLWVWNDQRFHRLDDPAEIPGFG